MTPRLKSLSVSLAVAAGLALPSTASNAASDWMNDYFNSAGAGLNVTPSAVYESQSQTTMSLGGFAYRAPQRATQFFSFSPPGYKAGCGGIDAWLGAYGFVNMDQFVAALRNIGQNAIGYFFQLALKTMAPEIDGLLTDLSKTMNGLNQFQISSCQAIKQFVGTTPDTRNMDMEQRAQVFGSALTGSYGSFFNAQNDTQTDPAKMQAAYAAGCAVNASICQDSSGKPILKNNFNLVFDALDRAGGYSQEEIELYISLFGTVTFLQNTSDLSSGFTTEYFKPTITWEDFLGPLTGTHTMKIRECPSGSDCLPYASANDEGTPRTTTGMTAIVYDQLHKLKDAIVNRTALTDPKALQIIAMTSTPIYQMIAQAVHSGRGSTIVADRIIDGFSEVIATEIAFRQMQDISREVEDALNKTKAVSVKADVRAIEDFHQSLIGARNVAIQMYALKQEDAGRKMQNITMMLDFQRQMYTSLGPRLTSNVEFGKAM
ncbi:hypothetical protein F8A86_11450 [Betaproteobacteria bacterium SCN1]|jgi:conjugative transfer pilus assembly protein TraH|nr:hypothetical protein F8A86_11450 [Betaproteobacteria bacterium SCN1]ODU89456.1 MAG: hypothetical protein ABT21_06980 [Thiobacillus sp. SCN 65-179]OJW37385.1 MAG: hypothetical protein BGO61_03315 [Thiobacillus sp. 65-69]